MRLKPPFLARHATMRSALAGPTVGSSCSCSSLAVLRLSLPVICLWFDFRAGGSSGSPPGRAGDADGLVIAAEGGGAAAAERVQLPPIAATSKAIAATGANRRNSFEIDWVMIRILSSRTEFTARSERRGIARRRSTAVAAVGRAVGFAPAQILLVELAQREL